MLFKYKLTLFLVVFFCLFLLKITYSRIEAITSSVDSPAEFENEDWELLVDYIFISRHWTFYFIDDSMITSIIISKENLQTNISCLIKDDDLIVSCDLRRLAQYHQISSYKLECPLKTPINVENGVYFSITKNISATELTKRPIHVQIKNTNLTMDMALCGTMLYLDYTKSYDSLKTWLEIQKSMGYKKVLIYVMLIENNIDKFLELFEKFKEILEIKYYKSIPNVFYAGSSNSKPYIKLVDYINELKKSTSTSRYSSEYYATEVHWVHHRAVVVAGFLSLYKDYKRVAVIDTDELIVPSVGKIKFLFHDKDGLISLNSMSVEQQQRKDDLTCEYDINKYFDNLNMVYFGVQFKPQITFWMRYSLYLASDYVKNMFEQLKIKLENQFTQPFNFLLDDKINFTFSVSTELEFLYLKSLLRFYNEHYVSGESLMKLETNTFKRIWMVQESETLKNDLGAGKVSRFEF